MKKIIIGLVIVIGVIAILPMIGNSVAEKNLEDKINTISTYGIEIKNEKNESSYFNTKKHYEFLLSDALKFIAHINQGNTTQMPLDQSEAALKGLVVGMDIEYSNIPIDSKLKIDMYPLKMPTEMDEIIKEGDKDFYSYLNKLFQNKTFLYHMNYDLSDDSFDGYMKNVDEKYEFANGVKLHLNILDAKYNGQGTSQAPNNLHVNVAKFAFDAQSDFFNFAFKMDKFNSDSVFESGNSTTDTTVKSIVFTQNDPRYSNTEVYIDSIKLNTLLKIVDEKIMFNSKSSVGEFKLNPNGFSVTASGFNYDITLDEVDKASFEKFIELLNAQPQMGSSYAKQIEIGESIKDLFSKGLKINIADLSLAKLALFNKEPIDGFSAVANLVVRENADLTKSPSAKIIDGVESFKANIKISKDLYASFNNFIPMIGYISPLAKEDANNMLFEFKLDDGDFTVNGKTLR